jgi:hypothetical protein
MTAPSHDRVAMAVVRFLGWAALLGLGGVIYLVHDATGYEKIDPSTVALVAGVSTLVGTAIGGLVALLANAGRPGPTPVTVENPPDAPVPVDPSPEAGPED